MTRNLGEITRLTDHPPARRRSKPLTPKQTTVLALHDEGYGPTAIARKLGIKRTSDVSMTLTDALGKVGRSE